MGFDVWSEASWISDRKRDRVRGGGGEIGHIRPPRCEVTGGSREDFPRTQDM